MNIEKVSDEVFDQIKEKSIEVWNTYDDEFGYVTEKVSRINSITNFKDNYYFIIGMFDRSNQLKLLNLLEGEARELVDAILTEAVLEVMKAWKEDLENE